MFTPVELKTFPGFRLWLRFADGIAGEVDLSHLAGKGVFSVWSTDPASFDSAHIGPTGQISWSDEIEICSDALYLQLAGKQPDDVFPMLRTTEVNA